MDLNTELLTLQKFIYLLDDFHYTEFKGHLIKADVPLSLKLTEVIRAGLPNFDTREALCKKLYRGQSKTEREKLDHLDSETFRLSNNLASNYPQYLLHNVEKTQRLVAKNKQKEANFLTTQLIDVAAQINDFTCQIFALQFLSQQAFMANDIKSSAKTDACLREVTDNQNLYSKWKLIRHHRLMKELLQ